MAKSRLQEQYEKKIRPELKKTLGLKNILQVPEVSKIVINVGVKEAVNDSRVLQRIQDVIANISGQKPVRTIAKKSIAGFKLREGLPIGVKVTLRRKNMYEFLDKLINLGLPKVRDFQGLPKKLDGRGNYNIGLREWTIFPEAEDKIGETAYGMNITMHTTAKKDEHAFQLLKTFGMPFKK